MDKKLFDYIHTQQPKFNPILAKGLAVEQMKLVEQYIDRIIRCAEPGFPEGLRYVGCSRCTPAEEYAVATTKRGGRQTYELTRSDIYLCKYTFSYFGEDIKRYLYLPFVSESGLITLLGSTFSISPVLADTAISVGTDSIFIPLNRDKLTFKRLVHHYIVDGTRETSYVIWSAIHRAATRSRSTTQKRRTIDVAATCIHYMFCKYGFTRTFAQFANAEVVCGMGDEITAQKYPPSHWRICESVQVKPRGVKSKVYQGTPIRLAIRNEHYNLTTSSMIAGFFYIADHFPDRMLPEYLDNNDHWKILMGHVIFANDESEGKLALGVEAHMLSLDGYIDGMVKEQLYEGGVYVDDIYDLFMHVVETFNARVTQTGNDVASMYGKRLTVLRYVLIDVIKEIFGVLFDLQKASKKKLTRNDINNIFNMHLKPELIIRMNRKHSEVTSISSSSDNMTFKITTNIVLQTNATATGRSKKAAVVEPSKLLHASIAEIGSFTNLPKSEPSGRSRINLFAHIGSDCSIERDPKKKELLDAIQEQIAR